MTYLYICLLCFGERARDGKHVHRPTPGELVLDDLQTCWCRIPAHAATIHSRKVHPISENPFLWGIPCISCLQAKRKKTGVGKMLADLRAWDSLGTLQESTRVKNKLLAVILCLCVHLECERVKEGTVTKNCFIYTDIKIISGKNSQRDSWSKVPTTLKHCRTGRHKINSWIIHHTWSL